MEPENQIPALPPLSVPVQVPLPVQELQEVVVPLAFPQGNIAVGDSHNHSVNNAVANAPINQETATATATFYDHPQDAVHALIGQRDLEIHAVPVVHVGVPNHLAALSQTNLAHQQNETDSISSQPTKLSSRKQQTRMDGIWYKHLDDLKEYKNHNGHVSVPRKSGSLGEWCRTQRRYFKQYRKGETVPLTKERMKSLEDLGFVWLPAEARKMKKLESSAAKAEGAGAGAVKNNSAVGHDDTSAMMDGVEVSVTAENDDSIKDELKVHYKTPELEKVHTTYAQSLSSLHRSNEKLCDAQNLLEKAMEEHRQALEEQKLAVGEMDEICDSVLATELNENQDDEWNIYYSKLLKYKEEHGEILFAKTPTCIGEGKNEVNTKADLAGDCDSEMNNSESANLEDEGHDDQDGDAMEVDEALIADNESEEAKSKVKTQVGIEPDVDAAVAAARDVVNDLSTSADNIKAEEDDTEKSLAEWVHSMRKAPKKSISEWRHRALDKIGFIW